MSKPNYRATLIFDTDRKVFLARAPELEHCSAEGASRAEALTKLEEEIDAQLANMLSHGSTPPRAVDEETFSGEISAKVSKQLHRELTFQARSEGIEIDQLVGELLAAAMESRKQTRGTRGGNRAPQEHSPQNDNVGNRYEGGGGPRPQRGFGGRGANTHLLDDRANFIEYVRGLEQQGTGMTNRHGGGTRRAAARRRGRRRPWTRWTRRSRWTRRRRSARRQSQPRRRTASAARRAAGARSRRASARTTATAAPVTATARAPATARTSPRPRPPRSITTRRRTTPSRAATSERAAGATAIPGGSWPQLLSERQLPRARWLRSAANDVSGERFAIPIVFAASLSERPELPRFQWSSPQV